MQIEQNSMPDLSFYQDLHSLESIKSNPDSQQALSGVARQFEVQFLQQVLHQMREASDALQGDDSLISSDTLRFYQEMSDSQLAMAMANQNRTGLQQQIVAQMAHTLPETNTAPASTPTVNTVPASTAPATSASVAASTSVAPPPDGAPVTSRVTALKPAS